MSQEKIREVLNAVDCIYEPKMLIELIRWQQEQLAKMRPDYMDAFEQLTNTTGTAAVDDIREFIAQYPEMLANLAGHHPVGIVRGLAGLLAETKERNVHLENALSGSPDLT